MLGWRRLPLWLLGGIFGYVGQVEDSEEEDVVKEGGCVDDDLLGCEVGCSPRNIIDRRNLSHPGTCFLFLSFLLDYFCSEGSTLR